MAFRHALLLALLLSPACRPQGPDSGQTVGGTPADSVTETGQGLGAAQGGFEFEAPRLIPGMLAQLQVVQDSGGRVSEGNAASYRNAAGRLVDAMLTDINRVGVGDDGSFRSMGDSVVKLVGEGAGDAPKADPERMQQSAAIMRRAIAEYQERMRAAQK